MGPGKEPERGAVRGEAGVRLIVQGKGVPKAHPGRSQRAIHHGCLVKVSPCRVEAADAIVVAADGVPRHGLCGVRVHELVRKNEQIVLLAQLHEHGELHNNAAQVQRVLFAERPQQLVCAVSVVLLVLVRGLGCQHVWVVGERWCSCIGAAYSAVAVLDLFDTGTARHNVLGSANAVNRREPRLGVERMVVLKKHAFIHCGQPLVWALEGS